MRIALFITCLADGFFPRAGIAAVRVLEHLGHEVVFPSGQTCCGQPMFNNGFRDDARALARRMVRLFEGLPLVVTPSGSCAAMVREHFAELFASGSAERAAAANLAERTREFAEALVEVLEVDLRRHGARWPGAIALHESCHARSLGLAGDAGVTRRLVTRIDGLELRRLSREETCCGFGGTFAVSYPLISGRMVHQKVRDIDAGQPDVVVSTDAGCTMNLAGACRRDGVDATFLSTAELVAESLGLLERTVPAA